MSLRDCANGSDEVVGTHDAVAIVCFEIRPYFSVKVLSYRRKPVSSVGEGSERASMDSDFRRKSDSSWVVDPLGSSSAFHPGLRDGSFVGLLVLRAIARGRRIGRPDDWYREIQFVEPARFG